MRAALQSVTLPRQWIIALVTVLTHGLLLLNDGVYWDGWYAIYPPLLNNDWDRLLAYFVYHEKVNRAFIHWFAGSIFGHKLLTFIAILVAALSLDHILRASRLFSRQESLLVVLIFVTFPAYQVHIELIMMPYMVNYAFFLVGMMGVFSLPRFPIRAQIVLRLLSWILLCLSYWTFSFLTLHFGFMLLLAARGWFVEGQRGFDFVWRSGLGWIDFWVLPFVFWAVYQLYFSYTAFNEAASYNISFLSLDFFISGTNFMTFGIVAHLQNAFELMADNPLLGIAILTASVGVWRYFSAAHVSLRHDWWKVGGVGAILLGLAIYPYVAVGLSPLEYGWATRHALLISLPLGILTVALLRFMGQFQLSQYFGVGVIALVGCFVILQWDVYFAWQARWVKDRAIMHNLDAQSLVDEASIVWFEDDFPLGYEQIYYSPEYSMMLYAIHDAPARFDQSGTALWRYAQLEWLENDTSQLDRWLFYGEFVNPNGCHLLVNIEEGPAPTEYDHTVGVSLRYFVFRYLLPDQMDAYLQDFVTLDMTRLPAPMATECPWQTAYLERFDDPYLTTNAEITSVAFSNQVDVALELLADDLLLPDSVVDYVTERDLEPSAEQQALITDVWQSWLANICVDNTLDAEQADHLATQEVNVLLYQLYRSLTLGTCQ